MRYLRPGQTFTAILQGAPEGVATALGVRGINVDSGAVAVPRILPGPSSGIVEVLGPDGSASGHYRCPGLVAPSTAQTFQIVWDHAAVEIPDSELYEVTFTPGIAASASGISLEEFKLHIDKQLSTDDAVLAAYLEAAFEQAQAPPPYGCGRHLLPDPLTGDGTVQRRVVARGSRFVRLPDAREITEVLADDVAVPAEDYEPLERNDHIVRLELPRGCRVAKVTGKFGFSAIPESLKAAIYILAARSFYERGAQFADQVAIAEGAAVQSYFRQMPPRTKLTFASFAVPDFGLA